MVPERVPEADERQRAYWRRSHAATLLLLLAWFCTTFVVGWFARDLQVEVAGWPLGFWVGAQGGLLVFVGINWFHARYMEKLDAAYGMYQGGDEQDGPAPPGL